MMAFQVMHAFQIQFVLHVHNIPVDENLDLVNLVSINTNIIQKKSFSKDFGFTSSVTLNTPTTRALHFIGRFFIGQLRGVMMISR